MSKLRHELAAMSPPLRGAVIGAMVLGAIGMVAGLVSGIYAYPPTAWFAVFEVGIPASIAGAIVGVIVGTVVWAVVRLTAGRGTGPAG